MLYLILAIISGSLFSVIFKLCQNRGVDSGEIILFNYITGTLFCFVPIFYKVLLDADAGLESYAIPFRSIALALVQGFLFFFAFWVMARSTRLSGVALTTAAARASLVLPVLFSWLFLSQGQPHWLSLGLVLLAMLLIVGPIDFRKHDTSSHNFSSDKSGKINSISALIGVFLTYGISDFFLKVVQRSASSGVTDESVIGNHLSMQMGFIFISATLCSLLYCIISGTFRRHRITLATLVWGIILGLVNTACTASILKALSLISTNLFYPMYNIGVVVIGTMAGVFFFREKIKGIQYAGLVMAVIAIAVTLLK